MHPKMIIGNREVGLEFDPLVIAEIGINHGGSLDVAIAMADAAIDSGADIVKHQTHIVDDEMSSAARRTIPGNSNCSIYDIMARCALDESEEWKLMNHVLSRGGIFLSTPFSRAAVDRLVQFRVPAFKIGSGECNNYPLLDYVASFGKPIILSTGMNDLRSVAKAVDILRRRQVPFALLHTTNLYPTPPELVRLGAMTDLAHAFPDAVVGLSDHTVNNLACFGAVALGASIVERHFTDSLERSGPDISCSADPVALRELVEGCRILKRERGGSKSVRLEEEQVTRDFAFATVVTIKAVPKGAVFTDENVWVKRPGVGGIEAEHLSTVIGRRARRDISADTHLDWADVAP